MNKKIFSIILSAIMAVVFIPSFAFADVAADEGTALAATGEISSDAVAADEQHPEKAETAAESINDVQGSADQDVTFNAAAGPNVPNVSMVKAVRSGNYIRIIWDTEFLKVCNGDFGTNLTYYLYYYSESDDTWNIFQSAELMGDDLYVYDSDKDCIYIDTNKLPLNEVHYICVGVDNLDDSYESISESDDYAVYTPELRTPVLTATVTGTTTVKLSWTKDTCATSYKLYRATSKTGTYKCIKTISSNSTVSYTNTGLTKNKTYYYKVRSYMSGSNKTSAIKSAKPRANVSPYIKSGAKKVSGKLYLEKGKVSYYNGAARFNLKIYNNSKHKAKKFKYIKLTIYDNKGNIIAKQTFSNIGLDLRAYKTTYKTFKFSYKNTKQHKANLRYLNSNAGFGYEYEYIYYTN